MPIQRVALADLEDAVDSIEKKYRILSISHPDAGSAVIHYEARGTRAATGDVETRA